MNTPTV